MLIKSQDGTVVLNNDFVNGYEVSDKWDGRFKVFACIGDEEAVIGRYSTMEKCKQVLKMILECHKMNKMFEYGTEENPRELCCQYVADMPIGVFEMPQEDEVSCE